jgi:hypothetical protein
MSLAFGGSDKFNKVGRTRASTVTAWRGKALGRSLSSAAPTSTTAVVGSKYLTVPTRTNYSVLMFRLSAASTHSVQKSETIFDVQGT